MEYEDSKGVASIRLDSWIWLAHAALSTDVNISDLESMRRPLLPFKTQGCSNRLCSLKIGKSSAAAK